MVLAPGKLKHSASIAKRRIFAENYEAPQKALQRFQQQDTYTESQQANGWDEDACRRLDKIASEDNSFISSWYERQRYENSWKFALPAQGKNALMKGRSDSDVARIIRDVRQKDEQENQ